MHHLEPGESAFPTLPNGHSDNMVAKSSPRAQKTFSHHYKRDVMQTRTITKQAF